MKSNPSPSAPLNLCPPTGVTGTTLPDDLTEDEIALAHVQSWPKAGIPDSGAHLDSPVKDTPAFTVDDVVRVISPENHPGEIFHGGTSGIVREVLPDPRKRFVYVCEGIGSWYENQIELMSRAPASPVDSVGVPQSPLMNLCDKLDSVLGNAGDEIARLKASHAAKDAKIRAMELALQTASQCIQEFFTMGESEDALALRKVFFTHRETALALPCA